MKKTNWRVIAGAFACGLTVTLLYLAHASTKDSVDWTTVVPAAVGVFGALFGVTYVILREFLGHGEQPIVPPQEFGLPLGRVVAVGTVALLVVMVLGLLAGSVLVVVVLGLNLEMTGGDLGAEMTTLSDAAAIMIPGFMAFVFMIPASFFAGRWVGFRCLERGIAGVVLMIGLSRVLVWLLDVSIMGFEEYGRLLSRIDASLWEFVAPVAFLMGIGVVGYWRGRRTRGSHYLRYLFRLLPTDTKEALLDLAYTEAVRLKA